MNAKTKPITINLRPNDIAFANEVHVLLATGHTYNTLSGFIPFGKTTGSLPPKFLPNTVANIIKAKIQTEKSKPGFLFIVISLWNHYIIKYIAFAIL